MKPADVYLKWVEWSEEDGAYIGRRPDLFSGGCHGSDPVAVYAELCEIVAETVASLESEGQPLPEVKTRPLATA